MCYVQMKCSVFLDVSSQCTNKLREFVEYMNWIHPSIQFTIENESDIGLQFFNVLISREEKRLGQSLCIQGVF